MDPNIFINPQAGTPSGIKSSLSPKYFFIILGVVVVIVVIIIGARALLQRDSGISIPATQTDSSNQTAKLDSSTFISSKLTLEAPKSEYKIGETIPVSIKIDTGGQTADGVDVNLKFDPEILEAKSSSITTGTIFPDFPVSKVDQDGTIRITGITSLQGEGFSGSGVFATINFKAKAKGLTLVKVEFTKGSTTDSNIVGTQVADDMLSEVKDLEVNIE